MSKTLELPDDVYAELEKLAAHFDVDPATWVADRVRLAAVDFLPLPQRAPRPPLPPGQRSLADRFAELSGVTEGNGSPPSAGPRQQHGGTSSLGREGGHDPV